MNKIPVVDLFAGPGGLGEGFTAYTNDSGQQIFNIVLSIEKDKDAHSTLELRSFFRKISYSKNMEPYYEYIRKKSLTTKTTEHVKLKSEFFNSYPVEAEQARDEAWHAELGKDNNLNDKIDARISEITSNPQTKCWGIIGGPPCQAYSVIGRSRNKGKTGYSAESDKRSYLYQQYLRIIARHEPDFFIMENVKGMLSAQLNGKSLFEQILYDLKFPHKNQKLFKGSSPTLEYLIYPLAVNSPESNKSVDFIVEAESYGIPQARHRVILLGVKKGFSTELPVQLQKNKDLITVKDVLGDLPALRSSLSREKKENNTLEQWIDKLWEIIDLDWFKNGFDKELVEVIRAVTAEIHKKDLNLGSEFLPGAVKRMSSKKLADWYLDKSLAGVCNHTSRSHMVSDLHRYLYAACFAELHGRSPLIMEFPDELIPEHKNAKSGNFNDRFRVQVADNPSTTVTSHISKDGNYFIHYDPEQSRSLTVREAARLQTFPDNFFFEGSRTQQYIQVGNAVPPLLARQIAEVVYDFIKRAIA